MIGHLRATTSALSAALLLLLFAPLPSSAADLVGPGDLLGRISLGAQRPVDVQFEEVDAVLSGALSKRSAGLEELALASLRMVCSDAAEARQAVDDGLTHRAWLEQQWSQSRPDDAAVESYRLANADVFLDGAPAPELLRHLLQLRSFKQLRRATANALVKIVPAKPGQSLYRLALKFPDAVVARCAGMDVSGAEVLSTGGPVMSARRRSLDELACSQFAASISSALVNRHAANLRYADELLEREDEQDLDAAGRNELASELLTVEAEATLKKPAFDEVLRVAGADLGAVDDQKMDAARARLHERDLARAERAILKETIQKLEVECAVELSPEPELPSIYNAQGQVVYFGAVGCSLCTPARVMLEALRAQHAQTGVTFDWQHNLQDGFAPHFLEAVAIECARGQGKLWPYLDARFSQVMLIPEAGKAAGLDTVAFSKCQDEPAAAIDVIQSDEWSRRLGFSGAIPSWVVGKELHRGWRSQETVGTLIEGLASAKP